MVQDPGTGQLTIGIAIAVPEPLATSLKQARLSYGDLQAQAIPTHVTVLPPTIVDADAMPAIREHLREIAGATAPFTIELLGTDSFRPVSPVVFVPLVRGARSCALLASRVRSGPLARDLDFSYHPHVTIGHNISDQALDEAERECRGVHAQFEVKEVLLYLRDAQHNWDIDCRFPFTAHLPEPS